jgi:hypothetical protein
MRQFTWCAGVGTYVAVSICTWTTLFVAIENNVDVSGLISWMFGQEIDTKEALERWGVVPPAEGQQRTMQGYLASKLPSVVMASVATKILVPVKATVAVVLTPYVHRVLKGRGLVK